MRISTVLMAIMITSLILAAACTPTSQQSSTPSSAPTSETREIPTSTATPTTPTSEPTPEPEIAEVTPTQESVSAAGFQIAYIGVDGNLFLLNAPGAPTALTQDAIPWPTGNPDPEQTIIYSTPRWSSDGRMLAFIREISNRAASGRDYQYDLMVIDLDTKETRVIIPGQQVTGYAWKPGTHSITFGLPVDVNFFMSGNTDSIHGLLQVDVDSGETSDLVAPEREFPLANPVWSPNGDIITFEEIYLMEGRGNFAYFDFASGEYIAWDEPVGGYSLSPDGSLIAFDGLTYTPTGTEQIKIRELAGGVEKTLSAVPAPDYAFAPVISPDGTRVAFFASSGGPNSQDYNLFVVPVAGGEPVQLSREFNPGFLSWTPDGTRLVFTRGGFADSVIVEIDPSTGISSEINRGSQPVLSGT